MPIVGQTTNVLMYVRSKHVFCCGCSVFVCPSTVRLQYVLTWLFLFNTSSILLLLLLLLLLLKPLPDSLNFSVLFDICMLFVYTTNYMGRSKQNCLQACARCADSDHPVHAQSIIRVSISLHS